MASTRIDKGSKVPKLLMRKLNKSYVMIYKPEHPRSVNHYVYEHILVAEKALGAYIPLGMPVHHTDENKTNNASSNLVICQDAAYHKFLHRRMRALAAIGDVNGRICSICRQWDIPGNNGFVLQKNGQARHKSCHNLCSRNRRKIHAALRHSV